MGEPAPAYALLRCPPDGIRCSCSEHDDDEQGGNSYRIGPTSPEIHWSEFRPSQSDCERRKIARPRSCASSVGVAPLTIGGAMSKARYPTADARQTTFALCKERLRRQLPARRAREAPKKVGGCRPSRYAKRAPVDQHPPGSRPQPSHANGIGWNPPQQLA